MSKDSESRLPIVCSLTPEALAARKASLLFDLGRDAIAVEEIQDGISLSFPPDALPAIAAAIDAERRCCRFLRFDLTVEPDAGPVRLTLTGPPGTREFLAALIES